MSQDSTAWLPAQDFGKLRRQCIATNSLFEDPYFPANYSSLFYNFKLPWSPEWKRPMEIASNPQLFVEGANRFDVEQGQLANSWLVAAMSSLAQHKTLLNQVIPPGQSFDHGYAGIFLFRFWHFGEWVDIVVDDRLPTHNGRLIFIHSEDDNEFWSALLEKAYAKLKGSYQGLTGGKPAEAMVDFTGGVVEKIDLAHSEADELCKKIQANARRSSLMSCYIRGNDGDSVHIRLESGLVKGVAYSVSGAAKVPTVDGKEVNLMRFRIPWGHGATEWNGEWSDDSPSWRTVPASKRKELEADSKEDGEFWMSFSDFQKHFTDFEICSVSIDDLYEDAKVKNWNVTMKSGSWSTKDGTAGGCRNFSTFYKNPQYVMELLEDDDGDGKCSYHIALLQKYRRHLRKLGEEDMTIGFYIYKAPFDGSDVLNKKQIDESSSVGRSGSFTNDREVQKYFDLDPGRYIIIPCSFKPDDEGDFLLRIFTEKSEKKIEIAKEDPRTVQMRVLFNRFAGSNNKIDAFELQDMLTLSLRKYMTGSVFSLDACRSMITMMDVDKTGLLNFDKFMELLMIITTWKKIYVQGDDNRTQALERNEFKTAVQRLGYRDISHSVLGILFNRFSTQRSYLKLEDFISCVCRIKIMEDAFKKASQDGTSVQLTQEEFFQTLDI